MRIRLTILLITTASIAFAQSDPESDTTRTYNADPVTVTATRVEVTRSNVTPSVSVLSGAELKAQPERSILSLISQQVPGVFVTERGLLGFGANTGAGQLTIRGIGGNPNAQVLMLVDGRPQFMGLFGHPLADSYLTTAAERVEIIRGPSSMLYGSNAMGGVINIITGISPQQGWTAGGHFSRGAFNTTTLSGRAGYRKEGWHASAAGTYQHTDGHRPQSAYTVRSASLRGGADLVDGLRFAADGSMTVFRTNDPGTTAAPFTDHWVDILRGYAGLSLDNRFGAFEGALRAVHNFGDHAIYDGFRSTDELTAITFYQSARLLPDNVITVGVDYKRYGGTVNAAPPPTKLGDYRVTEYAFSLQVRQIVMERLTLDGGIRSEHNSLYGTEAIPQLGASLRVNDGTVLRASAAKGFRSPAVFQFYLFPPSNTALKPERSYSYEIGVMQRLGTNANAEVVGYVVESRDLIEFVPGIPPRFNNQGNAINRGVEFSGAFSPSPELEFRGSYAYFHAAEKIASVPRHKLFIGSSYGWNALHAELSLQYVHTIFGQNAAGALTPMPSYLLAGIKARYIILPYATVSAGIDNLLNNSYQTIFDYPMPGRILTAGIDVSL